MKCSIFDSNSNAISISIDLFLVEATNSFLNICARVIIFKWRNFCLQEQNPLQMPVRNAI